MGRTVPVQRRHRGFVPAADRARLRHSPRRRRRVRRPRRQHGRRRPGPSTAAGLLGRPRVSRCGPRRAGGSTGSGGSPSGRSGRASSSTTPWTPISTPTATCSTADGCCSRPATTSTGHGGCATRSTGSSSPAATGRSSPATPASGRCATRPTTQSMICFKAGARTADPVRGTDRERTLTSCWSDPLVGRPETTTIGLSFTRGGYCRVGDAVPRGSGGYTVQAPDHWVFAGTGLRYGDEVGASATVVGYEVDGCAMSLRRGSPAPDGRRRRARHARGARRRSRPSDLDHR